jgi:hypothetical protein
VKTSSIHASGGAIEQPQCATMRPKSDQLRKCSKVKRKVALTIGPTHRFGHPEADGDSIADRPAPDTGFSEWPFRSPREERQVVSRRSERGILDPVAYVDSRGGQLDVSTASHE